MPISSRFVGVRPSQDTQRSEKDKPKEGEEFGKARGREDEGDDETLLSSTFNLLSNWNPNLASTETLYKTSRDATLDAIDPSTRICGRTVGVGCCSDDFADEAYVKNWGDEGVA
jgi:hypothetical protein